MIFVSRAESKTTAQICFPQKKDVRRSPPPEFVKFWNWKISLAWQTKIVLNAVKADGCVDVKGKYNKIRQRQDSRWWKFFFKFWRKNFKNSWWWEFWKNNNLKWSKMFDWLRWRRNGSGFVPGRSPIRRDTGGSARSRWAAVRRAGPTRSRRRRPCNCRRWPAHPAPNSSPAECWSLSYNQIKSIK